MRFYLLVLLLGGCVRNWDDSTDFRQIGNNKSANTSKQAGIVPSTSQHYVIKNSHGTFKVKTKTHDNVVEYGFASYYGTQFHNRLTAIGLIYDQWDMTCAHPSIRLPAIFKVSRTDNGKSVYVIATDRGPFVKKHKNRVIDLSAGAAHVLGMTHEGVAHVKVECLVDQTQKLRKNWHKHKVRGRIPYNLAKQYRKKW